MSVSIQILNASNESNEDNAAEDLKQLISSTIPRSSSGNLYIATNLTLCGQNPRDIDMTIWGKLDNCILRNFYSNDPQYQKKDLVVNDFCIVLELKESSIKRIRFEKTHFYVKYLNKPTPKDVTSQNEKQRYSLMNYLYFNCDVDAIVTNAIWFKSITEDELSTKTGNIQTGALPDKFGFTDMIRIIIAQGCRPKYLRDENCYILTSSLDTIAINKINEILFADRNIPSVFTRRKLELITQKTSEDIINQRQLLGTSLITLNGKAGTGKTCILLQAALQLANKESGKRCLLLTYNHALVSDIRRLLHYLDIPDNIDDYTVQIQTLHSFFMELMKTLGLQTNSIYGHQFDAEYSKKLKELSEYINDLMDANDIKTLKEDNQLAIDWDYILVDEAQDWDSLEKEILIKVYGEKSIIVADGGQQFVRSHGHLKWGGELVNLGIGRRQKLHLVTFVNEIAKEMGVSWKLKGDNQLLGGRVIIKNNLTNEDFQKLSSYCKEHQCENYDILFLVPPQMVSKQNSDHSYFKNKQKWNDAGCFFFDGTDERRRGQYPTKVEECRLFQYESCRGLEGWCVGCLQFDELLKWKEESFDENRHSNPLVLESRDEKLKKYLWMWTMLPFTRAIDTLIITLKNPNSDIGQILKRVAERLSDYVLWDIKS